MIFITSIPLNKYNQKLGLYLARLIEENYSIVVLTLDKFF